MIPSLLITSALAITISISTDLSRVTRHATPSSDSVKMGGLPNTFRLGLRKSLHCKEYLNIFYGEPGLTGGQSYDMS